MRTIFKQQLDICDQQTVTIPEDYKVLHLDAQEGVPCMWFECTAEAPLKAVDICCFGTGYRMPDAGTPEGKLEYLGTVITHGGMGVWHYYEQRHGGFID